MITMPQRSVTRFFIPLIDVLTLLFCIYLLMPIVRPSEEVDVERPKSSDASLAARERRELEQLRQEQAKWKEAKKLPEQQEKLKEDIARLRREKLDLLQKRLAIRVLAIGDKGLLSYYDPLLPGDRHVEITEKNVKTFVQHQRERAGVDELYFLILYPRVTSGIPKYPLQSQRDRFDAWFEDVAHGYDVPVHVP